ncbi:MAG TPA: hypothetical protein VKB94_09275 [Rhizomicrobium sp.]|nr:hypothetical protein [Rhizomicrobium sp.]
MWKSACATVALLALSNPALAAGCASPTDAAALKTAVMQQELMVAAFQCHEAGAYNRFVTTYRGELQSSDAALKAFFVRRGGEHGEAGYDTFKTKAANLSALEQARHGDAFCADAHALFTDVFAHRGSLMSFVESRATDVGNICVESHPGLAKTAMKADAGVKLAEARRAEIGGVPPHSLPAMPYRRENTAPPPRTQDDTRDDEDDGDAGLTYTYEENVPPPRPRYYEARNRANDERADYGYAPRSYGPPPNWQQGWRDAPPPRYGWYPRDPYGRW